MTHYDRLREAAQKLVTRWYDENSGYIVDMEALRSVLSEPMDEDKRGEPECSCPVRDGACGFHFPSCPCYPPTPASERVTLAVTPTDALCPHCNPCTHRSVIGCRAPATTPWADDGVKGFPAPAQQVPTAQTMGTHWEGCYHAHHDCAISWVESQAATIATLTTDLHNAKADRNTYDAAHKREATATLRVLAERDAAIDYAVASYQDVARWQWMRERMTHEACGPNMGWTLSILLPGDDPDAAIDAAMVTP